jgi:hypothetical protein
MAVLPLFFSEGGAMTRQKIRPWAVYADDKGNIYDVEDLQMLCRRGRSLELPRPDELIPLPEGSDFFLLPRRRAIGLDPATGKVEALEGHAVAAFACPGYTLSALTAYEKEPGAPVLPLFAYGALGFYEGRFYVCAKKVDEDKRQVFAGIPDQRIRNGARRLLSAFPGQPPDQAPGRLRPDVVLPGGKESGAWPVRGPSADGHGVQRLLRRLHLPAACRFGLPFHAKPHRFQANGSRDRADHARPRRHREAADLLLRPGMRRRAPHRGRASPGMRSPSSGVKRGKGTVNVNTNASLPSAIPGLADAGLDSIRVSLNSARPELYSKYYRPRGYAFDDVLETIRLAKAHSLFVSLNYLFFPGVNDTEEELEALLA